MLRSCILVSILFPVIVYAQTITGNFINEKEEPIIFASITYSNSNTINALSDTIGNFSIKKILGDTLIINALGYKQKTVAISETTNTVNIV